MLRFVIFLLCTLFCSATYAAWPTTADRLSRKLVFAEFHPWAGTPAVDGSWARWNENGHNPAINDVISTFWPLNGLYSENDCASVQSQGANLNGLVAGAGIDVLIIDWVNVYANEQARVETILKCANMPVVIMVDVNWSLNPPSFQDAVTRLETAIGWYASRTDLFPNYYRDPDSGAPVFIVYDPGTTGTVDQWNAKIDFYKTLSPRGIFIAGLGAGTPVSWVVSSHFDGGLALASTLPTSDQATYEWVLSNFYQGPRNQFLIAEAIPGFDDSTIFNCASGMPKILDRNGGVVFDTKWAGIVGANWNGHKIDGAYVMYNNDGEGAGIEPASPTPPVRGPGFASCNGHVSNHYSTYAPLPATYYLNRNAFWANQFRSTR